MEETNYPSAQTSLTEELSAEIQYEYATTWQRFFNFLVDNLLMRFGLSYLTGTAVGMLLGLLAPEYILRISENPERIDLYLIGYLVGIVNYLIYYTICEKGFRGYTLGKAITFPANAEPDRSVRSIQRVWRSPLARHLDKNNGN